MLQRAERLQNKSIAKFLKRKGDDSAEINADLMWMQTQGKVKENKKKHLNDEMFNEEDLNSQSIDIKISFQQESSQDMEEMGIGKISIIYISVDTFKKYLLSPTAPNQNPINDRKYTENSDIDE